MKRYSPEVRDAMDAMLIDNHDSLTLVDMTKAQALPVSYGWLVWRRSALGLDPGQRRYHRFWSAQDDELLMEKLGLVSDKALARLLGRSTTAIQVRIKRKGITRKMAFWTALQVADLFGVDSHVVTDRWIRDGMLKAGRAPFKIGRYRPYKVDETAIVAFIRRHPQHYDRRLINDPYFRRLAESAWRVDPILHIAEAADIIGVHPATLTRHCARGWLPATRTRMRGAGRHGRWTLRRSDLLTHFRLRRYSTLVKRAA